MASKTEPILPDDYGLPAEQVGTLAEITAGIHTHARQGAENYLAAGHLLLSAKNLLKHGEFIRWLDESFCMNQRTAQRMMAAAESFKNDSVSHLSISALIELSKGNVPEDARKEAVKRAASGEKVTKTEAKAIVAKHADPVPAVDVSGWDDPEPAADPAVSFYDGEPEGDGEWQVPNLKESAVPFDILLRELGEWEKRVTVNLIESDDPGTAFLDRKMESEFKMRVQNIREMLKQSRPYSICADCMGQRCKTCRQSGLVPRRFTETMGMKKVTA